MYRQCSDEGERPRGGQQERGPERKARASVYSGPVASPEDGQARVESRDGRSSNPEGGPVGATAEQGEIPFFSWNIGGKAVDAALTATDHSKGLKLTSRAVFAFQELPRIDPGWRHPRRGESAGPVQGRGPVEG